MADGGASLTPNSNNLPLEEGRLYIFPPSGKGRKAESWTIQSVDPRTGNVILGRPGKNGSLATKEVTVDQLGKAKAGAIQAPSVRKDQRFTFSDGTADVLGFDSEKKQVLLKGTFKGLPFQRWVDAGTVSSAGSAPTSDADDRFRRLFEQAPTRSERAEDVGREVDVRSKNGKKIGLVRFTKPNTIEIQDGNGFAYGSAVVKGKTAVLYSRDGKEIGRQRLKGSSLTNDELADLGQQVRKTYIQQRPGVEWDEDEDLASKTQAVPAANQAAALRQDSREEANDESKTPASTVEAAQATPEKMAASASQSTSNAKTKAPPLTAAPGAVVGVPLEQAVGAARDVRAEVQQRINQKREEIKALYDEEQNLQAKYLQSVADAEAGNHEAAKAFTADDNAKLGRLQAQLNQAFDEFTDLDHELGQAARYEREVEQAPDLSADATLTRSPEDVRAEAKERVAEIRDQMRAKREQLTQWQGQEYSLLDQVRAEQGRPDLTDTEAYQLAGSAQQAQIQQLRTQISVSSDQYDDLDTQLRANIKLTGTITAQSTQPSARKVKTTITATGSTPPPTPPSVPTKATVTVSGSASASASPSSEVSADISNLMQFMRAGAAERMAAPEAAISGTISVSQPLSAAVGVAAIPAAIGAGLVGAVARRPSIPSDTNERAELVRSLGQTISTIEQRRTSLAQYDESLTASIQELESLLAVARSEGNASDEAGLAFQIQTLSGRQAENSYALGKASQDLAAAKTQLREAQGPRTSVGTGGQSRSESIGTESVGTQPTDIPQPIPPAAPPRVPVGPAAVTPPGSIPRGSGVDPRQDRQAWMNQFKNKAPVQLQQGLALDSARQRESMEGGENLYGGDTQLSDTKADTMSYAGGGQQPLLGKGGETPSYAAPKKAEDIDLDGDHGKEDYQASTGEQTAEFSKKQASDKATAEQFQGGKESESTGDQIKVEQLSNEWAETENDRKFRETQEKMGGGRGVTIQHRSGLAPSEREERARNPQNYGNRLDAAKAASRGAGGLGSAKGKPPAQAPQGSSDADTIDRARTITRYLEEIAGFEDIIDPITMLADLNLRLIYTHYRFSCIPPIVNILQLKPEKATGSSKREDDQIAFQSCWSQAGVIILNSAVCIGGCTSMLLLFSFALTPIIGISLIANALGNFFGF